MSYFARLLKLSKRASSIALGDWQWSPPAWVRGMLAHPRQTLLALVTLAGLSWIAPTLYQWATAPDPKAPPKAVFTVQSLALPDFARAEVSIPQLDIDISQGVAKLELVDKEVDKEVFGISMQPNTPGIWRITRDDHLNFTPSAHWPVGAKIELQLPAELFKPEASFESLELEFEVPAFSVTLGQIEFYQDPTDPEQKKTIVEYRFTHPVDRRSFETAVTLKAVDGGGTAIKSPSHSVVYGDYDLSAFVHSENLQVPRNGGQVLATLNAGVRAALGGNTEAQLESAIALPSRYSLRVDGVEFAVVETDSGQPEQLLVVSMNNAVKDSELAKHLSVYLLPAQHPDPKHQGSYEGPYPWSASEVGDDILKSAKALPVTLVAGEREVIEAHTFKFKAPAGRYLYFRVRRDLASFGGFLLAEDASSVITVGEFPKLLRLAGEGALLSLRGERRLTVLSRNQPGFTLEIARLLPKQLQHLVSENNGSFQQPELWNLDIDRLTDRLIKQVDLGKQDPAQLNYEGIDLGSYLAPDRRGIFQVSLFETASEDDIDNRNASALDRRLIVLTDLGLLSKRTLDGGRDVFVQELSTGQPALGARISIMAVNGETLESAVVGSDGRVRFAEVDTYQREKRAITLVAERGEDISFLPLNHAEHSLDFSRFSIGGEQNPAAPGQLDAFVFSDRGIYRPGDSINIGMLLRAYDWQTPLAGIPLQARITDPRGALLLDKKIEFNAEGFRDLNLLTSESSSTGSYLAELRMIKPNNEIGEMIGSSYVQVQEFLPDRLKARIVLDPGQSEGWVAPETLQARVEVQNLFGTPAQQRRVTSTIHLTPSGMAFARYPDFQFFDPQRAKRSFSEALVEAETDADGVAQLALNLGQYDGASYQAEILIEAFEADGGRGVSATQSQLVSSNAYLIGIKSRDNLDYVKRGDARKLELLAVASDLSPVAPADLGQRLIQINYVSVLSRQASGAYKYQSELREKTLSEQPLTLANGQGAIALATGVPGRYRLEIFDGAGKVLNMRAFQVAGEGNVSRTLERNAELQLLLARDDVPPGEELELSITAPYVGAGLITLERDRVYAHAWFRSESTSSVQRIRIPDDFEGSGYINVQFLRDPASPEIYMSPLSYAVQPFSAGKGHRTQPLRIDAPKLIKPGQSVAFTVHTDGPAQVALYAVDEGILNVANYKLPQPLEHFFRKRTLDVASDQILSLLLPEFSQLRGDAAPGGDAESTLNNQLNPFKRKRDKPAAYWSGVVPVDGSKTFRYEVPETFNGRLKVMAVAATAQRIGSAQADTLVRDDFILSPNFPSSVAPGDRFEISVGVANQSEDVEQIELSLTADAGLKLLDGATRQLRIKHNAESSARFEVEALQQVGAAGIKLSARGGSRSVQRRVELSVRPLMPFQASVRGGRLAAGSNKREPELRAMWAPFSRREASISATPLVLVQGLRDQLEYFPHRCSEQLVSQSFADLLLAERPEWRADRSASTVPSNIAQELALVYAILSERQGSHGGLGLWLAAPDPEPFVTAYAALLFVEASERQLAPPAGLQQPVMTYLRAMASDDAKRSLPDLRTRALAAYVLTRQGILTTDLLALIAQTLQSDFPQQYASDPAAALLAASFALLKKDQTAQQWLTGPMNRMKAARTTPYQYDYYDDPYIRDAWSAYLIAKHFPSRMLEVQAAALDQLSQGIAEGRMNTLSSAITLLALDAFGDQHGDVAALQLKSVQGEGQPVPFGELIGMLRQGSYPDGLNAIEFANGSTAPVWYGLRESGFDRVLPTQVRRDGIELIREYVGADGKPVQSLTAGDEIYVRIKLRGIAANVYSIAIIDLLPGGFEVVQPRPTEEQPAPPPVQSLGQDELQPEYQDVREDRVLTYASALQNARQFSYAIKATNPGTFQTPPAFAMSMYDNKVIAVQPSNSPLVVRAPGATSEAKSP